MRKTLAERLKRLESLRGDQARDDDLLWQRVFLARQARGLALTLKIPEPAETQFVRELKPEDFRRIDRIVSSPPTPGWNELFVERMTAARAAGIAAGPRTRQTYTRDLERVLAQLRELAPRHNHQSPQR